MSDHIPKLQELLHATEPASLADRVHALLERQQTEWPQLAEARDRLKLIDWRIVRYADAELRLQHNPGRMASSAARTDTAAVARRPCFLCPEHQPAEQQSMWFCDYRLQANPYPIFANHLTISARTHTPQLIGGELPLMLALARGLGSEFSMLYNGARCGASAPDHRHFQAGERGFLPLDTQYQALCSRHGRNLPSLRQCEVVGVDDGMRRMVLLVSDSAHDLSEAFDLLRQVLEQFGVEPTHPSTRTPSDRDLTFLNRALSTPDEPMMNLLLSYERGFWRLMVFLRSRHRPDAFFALDPDRVVFSPGAVDMGGVCIFPVARDFERVNGQELAAMLQQVALPQKRFGQVLEVLERRLKRRS